MMTGTLNGNDLLFPYKIITAFILLLFALYDQKHHLILNKALLFFMPWCLFSLPIRQMSTHLPLQIPVYHSLLGFLFGFSLLYIISLLTGGSIGGGDIKLISLLGIITGELQLMELLIISSFSALLVNRTITIFQKRSRKNIPFAPYLFWGYLCVTFF